MPFAQVPADSPWDGPIIRVVRATMSGRELRHFEPMFETTVARLGERWVANFSLWWGTAAADGRTRVAIVSGWDGVAALRRARAGLREVRGDDPVAFLDQRAEGEIWPMIDQAATSLAPSDGATLRLVRLPLRPDAEGDLTDYWAPLRARLVESGELAGSQLARRIGPDGPTALVVNVWRGTVGDDAATAHDRLFGADLPPGLVRSEVTAETFTLRPAAILRLAPGGAALLIVDDDGRIVDATPAASSMLATDVWDVLDRRLQDLVVEPPEPLVPGELAGTYRFRRPEGGTILLRTRGAADIPVPERNALLLAPGSDPAPTREDLEASIAASYRRRNAPSA